MQCGPGRKKAAHISGVRQMQSFNEGGRIVARVPSGSGRGLADAGQGRAGGGGQGAARAGAASSVCRGPSAGVVPTVPPRP